MANSPAQRLAQWLETSHGASLLREEVAALSVAARRFHGDALLWVGCHEAAAETVRGCMVRHRLFASEVPGQYPEELSSFSCELEALPLPNSSLDAMVLHHALEATADPRAGLREAARVLMPGARLVVCGFNPLSLWGLRSGYGNLRDDSFSGLHFVTTFRLMDWLALLGFELQTDIKYLAYGLPFATGKQQQAPAPGRVRQLVTRLQPPVGGVYVISVVKQAVARKPRWRDARVAAPKLIPVAYPKSTVNRTRAPVLELRPSRAPRPGGGHPADTP
ncbi:MAG: class I SAM-dependent methyltransferase [Pseudomonadales bacterium]